LGLEGYVLYLAIIFAPGVGFGELLGLRRSNGTLVERIAMAFGLGIGIDTVVLAIRTSGLTLGNLSLTGVDYGTLYFIILVGSITPQTRSQILKAYALSADCSPKNNMQRLKGKRTIWIVVAIVIVALVAGLMVQRMVLTSQPSSYQDRLNQIESQGYSPQQAAWIASSNITVASSNATHADMIVHFPSTVSAEVIIKISANQTFTPTQAEVDNTSSGTTT